MSGRRLLNAMGTVALTGLNIMGKRTRDVAPGYSSPPLRGSYIIENDPAEPRAIFVDSLNASSDAVLS